MKFKVIVLSDDNTEVDYSINLLSSEEAQVFIKGWQSLQNEAAQQSAQAKCTCREDIYPHQDAYIVCKHCGNLRRR